MQLINYIVTFSNGWNIVFWNLKGIQCHGSAYFHSFFKGIMSNLEKEFSGCTRDVFHRNVEDEEPFCTQDNWQSAVMYLNQDIELQGLPSIYNVEQGQR